MKDAMMLTQGKHINGVFLGGHKPLFHSMVNELPSDLQKKLRRGICYRTKHIRRRVN